MTIRLSGDQAEALEILATVDGQPMSEVLREALQAHIDQRKADPEWQARLRSVLDSQAAALAALRLPDVRDLEPSESGFIVCPDPENCTPYGDHYERLHEPDAKGRKGRSVVIGE